MSKKRIESTNGSIESKTFNRYLKEYKSGSRTLEGINSVLKKKRSDFIEAPYIINDRLQNLKDWVIDEYLDSNASSKVDDENEHEHEWDNGWRKQQEAAKAINKIQGLVGMGEHIHATEIFIISAKEIIENLTNKISNGRDRELIIREAAYLIDLIAEKGEELLELKAEVKALEELIGKIQSGNNFSFKTNQTEGISGHDTELPDYNKVSKMYHKESGSTFEKYDESHIAPVMKITMKYLYADPSITTVYGHINKIREKCDHLEGGREAKANWIKFYAKKAGLLK